jgi:methionine-rich copper-binding protein CopC
MTPGEMIMPSKNLVLAVIGVFASGLMLAFAQPLYAQPTLIDASPAPNAELDSAPQEVVLTFSHALEEEGNLIVVANEAGQQVDNQDVTLDEDSQTLLSVSLPPLPEGRYQVIYMVASTELSTDLSGQYEFSIMPPKPRLTILSPDNGEAFTEQPVVVELETSFFDLNTGENNLHLYVDGELTAELHILEYTLAELPPGVHEIGAVLAVGDDVELAETATTTYIAIAQPDIEIEGREQAAAAEPDTGLQLSTGQWIGVISVTAILLGIGIVLGIKTRWG